MTGEYVMIKAITAAATGLIALGILTAAADRRPEIAGHDLVNGSYVPAAPGRVDAPATPWQAPFPEMVGADTNPMTPEKVELGRLLFFDPVLGGDNTMACATCHNPLFGLSDGRPRAMGFGGTGVGPERHGGAELGRNSPTLWNAAYNFRQFWDGRANDLEHQAAFPIQAPDEMNQDPDELVDELLAIPAYVERFRAVFGGEAEEALTFDSVVQALAAFERTLLSFNSKFDRFAGGDESAMNLQERRGMELFMSERLKCIECHKLPTFSDDQFHVIGVPEDGTRDPGRAKVPGEGPFGAFKVPTLRNIEVTGPYMHNGHFTSLDAILDFYSKGAGKALNEPDLEIDQRIRPFTITPEEKEAVLAFLHTLTDDSCNPVPPEAVPSGLPVQVAAQ